MKFRLSTAGSFYAPEDAAKLEKLGFKFESSANYKGRGPDTRYQVGRSSEVEIGTLDELLSFAAEWGGSLVVTSEGPCITIYDDYLE